MARGWESKAVEQQQSELTEAGSRGPAETKTAEQLALERKRYGLELSRQRVRQQLQLSCNPNHRKMLEEALRELEEQISAMGEPS